MSCTWVDGDATLREEMQEGEQAWGDAESRQGQLYGVLEAHPSGDTQ